MIVIEPALIDAIVGLTTEALNGPTVLDGQGVTDATGDMVWIGWDPFSDESTRFTTDWAEVGANYGAAQTVEGDVNCSMWVGDGTTDAAEVRAKALAYMTDLGTAIRANPTLGIREVVWCAMGQTVWRQTQYNAGAALHISFAIHVNAFI
jgi:hypothetical protein